MNAAVICLLALAVFAFGYFVYSRHLARRVFELHDDEPVPSREREDGIDYVPTTKHVLPKAAQKAAQRTAQKAVEPVA